MLNRILLVLTACGFFIAVATVSAEPTAQPALGQTAGQPATAQQQQIDQAIANSQKASQEATAAAQKAATDATAAATKAADQANKAAQQAVDAAKASQQSSAQIQQLQTQQQQQGRARLGQPNQQRTAIKVTGKNAATQANAAPASQDNEDVAPSDRIPAK